MNIYNTLKQLGLEFPPSPLKGGVYQPVKQVDNLSCISGQGAARGGIPVLESKLGKERSVEQGQEATKICALNTLGALYDYLGNLNQVKDLVKMSASATSADDFNQQPIVANGASQLLKGLYGEDSIDTRSAIGMNEPPGNIPVGIEFIFEI